MKIETQPRDDHQVTMIVTLEAAQMEGARRRAARKISARRSVHGFRPGKAPYEVVLRTFGEATVTEEAVDLLLDEVYPQALAESKLEAGASGTLANMEDLDKEPKFTFTVPLAPKVELGDYRSVRIPYDWQEPGEDELDKALEDLRQMRARTENVERPIQTGDFALVDVKGVRVKAAEGEAPAFERAGLPIFIRKEERAGEWPFPGFSAKLVGASQGESKTFSHKFPKDHEDESLRGQTVKFEVAVKMVRGSILPDLDDEFAKQLGPFENIQALREALKADLASRSKSEYDDDFLEEVMKAIKAGAVIQYAPPTLDHEVEHVMEDLKSRLAQQGMDVAAYIKSRDMDEEKYLAEEARPVAVKRLERALLLDKIAEVEKIEVGREQLDDSFQQTFYEMAGSEDFQKYMRGKSQPPKQMLNAIATESAYRAHLRLTLERLKAIATGQAPELSAEEAPVAEEEKARKPARKAAAKPSAKKAAKPGSSPRKTSSRKAE